VTFFRKSVLILSPEPGKLQEFQEAVEIIDRIHTHSLSFLPFRVFLFSQTPWQESLIPSLPDGYDMDNANNLMRGL